MVRKQFFSFRTISYVRSAIKFALRVSVTNNVTSFQESF